MIKSWKNGALGSEVKSIIEYNFNLVSRYLSKDIKALSTKERSLLPSDYLSENTLVFDTTEEQWYKYSGGTWRKTSVEDDSYIQTISVDDWKNNTIQIDATQHAVSNPMVEMFIFSGGSFVPVIGGIEVDNQNNVILSSDMPFNGKVVIK